MTAEEVLDCLRKGGSSVGMTTVYRHLEKLYDDGVLVKQNYVKQEADGNYVYVVNGNQMAKIKVYIVARVGTNYLLRNDFKAGDYLIIDDVSNLSKNQKIKIKVVNGEQK